MQGFERMDRQLTDAAALAGHLVPAGSMFAFLAAHRADVFPDADYADLFARPGVGRPSLPATPDGRGAGAAGAARLFGPGDRRGGPVRRAVEGRDRDVAGRCGVRPVLAGVLAEPDRGVGPPAPGQQRGQEGGSEETGVLAGQRRRAADSTILADAVATQDTVTQLVGRGPPGGAGGAWRGGGDRGGLHRA